MPRAHRTTDSEVAVLHRCVALIATLATPDAQERVASYLYERFTDAPIEFTLGRPEVDKEAPDGA